MSNSVIAVPRWWANVLGHFSLAEDYSSRAFAHQE
jgi:hypothetical protein